MALDPEIFGNTASAKVDDDIFKDVAPPKVTAAPAAAPAQESKPLPVNAGLAKFLTSAVGLPVDMIESALNVGARGVQALKGNTNSALYGGNAFRNSAGGSQWLEEKMRQTGMPGLSPDNPAPNSQVGTAQYDFTSRGGFIPGGALPAAGSMVAEKIGGPDWAGVGAMTPQAAIKGYNAARAPSLAKSEAENVVRDATLRDATKEGYVVPPSAADGGFISKRLESVAGKAAIGQDAAVTNQKITTEIARRELGLPKMAPLTENSLDTLRDNAAAPYREVAKIDPEAARALEKLKQVRFDANANYKFYNAMPNPEVLAKAKGFSAEAARLEDYIEQIAANAGKPGLVGDLRQSRTLIAKTYDVERALNIGTGDVSARMLGSAMDKGKPLSGGLATAAKFAEGFPAYARDGASIPTPGVSKSEALASLILGLGGFSATGGNPLGLAAAALPLASGPTRAALLSKPYQNAVMPSYTPGVNAAPNPQLLYQLGILQSQQRGALSGR